MPSRSRLIVLLAFAGILTTGCNKPVEPLPIRKVDKDYERPLPPGKFALRQVAEKDYPAFGKAWYRGKRLGLRDAVGNSIAYLKNPSSRQYYPLGPITHARVLLSLERFLDVLDQADSPAKLDDLIRRNFDVFQSIGCDDEGTVLFTGYYSPIFEGSLEPTEEFRYPLYRLPPGLEKDRYGEVVGGPWRTREEIETSGEMSGHELIWLSDRFEAYVVSVQGSGFIRLPDDTLYEVGYAGNNGHEYTPVSKQLVSDGAIQKRDMSLATMIAYFRQHPEEMDKYLFQNKRYIFFQEANGGPYGCLGKPVTPEFSIATDKDIFPRGALAFISTKVPDDGGDRNRLSTFILDQDRGAAIRAPGRCDIYMGVGEEAGKRAGWTYSEGGLYYLFAKDAPMPEGSLATDKPAEPVITQEAGYEVPPM
ncbi:MAG TPA: MltA domain-containing protein [Phycisphaerae bacterium]|nr:MltA domain-containing protein [Phycisphaerae bacterium]HRW51988.1 MltA domain-containing protein [Phycisphaerae bacterium]